MESVCGEAKQFTLQSFSLSLPSHWFLLSFWGHSFLPPLWVPVIRVPRALLCLLVLPSVIFLPPILVLPCCTPQIVLHNMPMTPLQPDPPLGRPLAGLLQAPHSALGHAGPCLS
jgi:hypothetical protein